MTDEQDKPLLYVEQEDEVPFDWNAFLDKADKNNLSADDWEDAGWEASDWTTCACGNQCAVLPRDNIGKPLDKLLVGLGMKFCRAIIGEDIDGATAILAQIEQRSAYLLTCPNYTDPTA